VISPIVVWPVAVASNVEPTLVQELAAVSYFCNCAVVAVVKSILYIPSLAPAAAVIVAASVPFALVIWFSTLAATLVNSYLLFSIS
jgi:uncharacterized membrane-anchored protein